MPALQRVSNEKLTAFLSPKSCKAEAQNVSAAEAGTEIRFHFAFNSSLSENDLNWNEPGCFEIDKSGRWVLQTAYLSNMQKSGSALYVGQIFKFEIQAVYYDGPLDEAGRCTGNSIYTKCYVLARLDYKEQIKDLSKSGVDAEFSKLADRIRSGSFVRVIH